MNIYVVPEIDIERFKETGVFAVQLLNNEAMAHDGIYLESDRAKEFAEFFKDNIFPAEKFEELVEWGIKADAESASLVQAIIHSRVWEYEQKRAMTMDQVLVQLCIREYPSMAQMPQKQVTLTYSTPCLMKDDNPSWNDKALQMERIRQSQKATTEAVNAMALGKTQGAGKRLRIPGKRNLSPEKKDSGRTEKSRNQQKCCRAAHSSFDAAA